jgi:hypothetical protein
MGILSVILGLVAADASDSLAKKMLPIYVKEAAEYSIAVERDPEKTLELRKEPVFEWSSPGQRGFITQGVLFVWLRDGRPAALGSVFSTEPKNELRGRTLVHELHALDSEKLIVTRAREALNEWVPRAGLARKVLPDAPTPANTPGARLVQMRRLAQEFSGHEIDNEGERWELRLLPTPLYRYPTARAGVVDGALFALVSNAGTDPEVLLLLEAREAGGKMHWEYALGRFSDRSLYVHRKEKEVWSMVMGGENVFAHDPLHLYRAYPEKVVSLEGKLLARIRQTATGQELIPVEDR